MSYRTGRSQFRLEDGPLIRGQGRYVGDRRASGEAYLVVVRSPVAAGRITELDVADARQSPGVLAVLTAADLPPELVPFEPRLRHPGPDGVPMFVPPYLPLTKGAVRYVGDPVVAVIADTLAAAEAAGELVRLEIAETESVVDPDAALAKQAPLVWPESAGNLAFRFERGDRPAVEASIAKAAHRISRRLEISRVIAAPIETRSALAEYDTASGRYSLAVGTQSPHRMAEALSIAMGVPLDRLRVASEDTGGAFGMKNSLYPEYVLALLAARLVGRPVRWDSTRVESFMADSHSREQVVDVTLGVDQDGRFLALDVRSRASLGAYLGPMSTHPMTANIGGLAGVYRTPAIAVTVEGVFTNTQNMAPYRGAGRPEATYLIERMVDLAAHHLSLDAAEIRRRNMVTPEQMPYRTPLGLTYDCGDFPAVLQRALDQADWEGFPTRRADSAARGQLRGIGLSNPIEIAGGPPGNPMPEFARIEVDEAGDLVVRLGSGDTGQGHRTTFAHMLADRLGVAPDSIRFLSGDTDLVSRGTGTFGSRTSSAAGTALYRATDEILEKALLRAASRLEVAADDIEFVDGSFRVVGTDRSISFPDVVKGPGEPLSAENFTSTEGATYPNGCHVCEVEIDTETGVTRIASYLVVDDVGTVLNPALVKGQIHGGVAQGVGQALMERVVYSPESGQLLTASFMDYAMPRADDFPALDVTSHPVPTATNPLGAKGVGEAGVVGALPAVINAVCNALAPLGIAHIDMPATPDRVWHAIQAAKRTAS